MFFLQKLDLSDYRAIPPLSYVNQMKLNGDIRTPFQRDRDRILYSKAFRRLARKTQVFFSGHDDHIRTRLTHTLEVSQIARTISDYLGLDINLTEAIALGHDIGHAPFGHVGERVINNFANGCERYKDFNNRSTSIELSRSDDTEEKVVDDLRKRFMGFKHNWQAVRIVEDLARHGRNEVGLSLTPQTVFGILFHTKLEWGDCKDRFGEYCKLRERGKKIKCKDNSLGLGFYTENYKHCSNLKYFTFEAAVVAISDEIAQRHHDLEDGLRFDLVKRDEVIRLLDTNRVLTDSEKNELKQCTDEDLINRLSSILIRFYVMKAISYINHVINESPEASLHRFIDSITTINKLQEMFDVEKVYPDDVKIKALLKHRVLYSYQAQGMDGRAEFLLRRLFKAYISNPQQLPDTTIRSFFRIYMAKSVSIDIRQLADKLHVNFSSISQQSQIDQLSNGQLREVLKYKHTKGMHVYKGCLLRAICDLVSGMTDHKAQLEYKRLYGVDS